jgi:ADP-heptose:LPS heptosyltransferase
LRKTALVHFLNLRLNASRERKTISAHFRLAIRPLKMVASNVENFLQRTRLARKVMVLDLGFLGDTVHLLPALWMVRQAYPQAELHVTVAAHITSLMDCVPWVNHVWGYMRYPRHATLKENWQMVARLRREKFDVVINLNGSNRSSWLTFFSGARERLGRMPEGGGPPFWKRMFTAHVSHPFGGEPVYLQRCRCLEKAGFPFTQPEFHVKIDLANLRAAEITEADTGDYFHISPFTTADARELPPEQLAELIAALAKTFPEKRIVLSCAPTPRELEKMDKLLSLLPQKPWRVFAGNLNLVQLAAVIQNSALHFCGNTGALHLAVMTNTPTVAWFWPNPGMREWVPTGEKYQVIVGTNQSDECHLCNVETRDLMAAVQRLAKFDRRA